MLGKQIDEKTVSLLFKDAEIPIISKADEGASFVLSAPNTGLFPYALPHLVGQEAVIAESGKAGIPVIIDRVECREYDIAILCVEKRVVVMVPEQDVPVFRYCDSDFPIREIRHASGPLFTEPLYCVSLSYSFRRALAGVFSDSPGEEHAKILVPGKASMNVVIDNVVLRGTQKLTGRPTEIVIQCFYSNIDIPR